MSNPNETPVALAEMTAKAKALNSLAATAKLMGKTEDEMRKIWERYDAASTLRGEVFLPVGKHKTEDEVYPDDTARNGYQIVRADEPLPDVGALVRYGTGGRNHGMVGVVKSFGSEYDMEQPIVVQEGEYKAGSGYYARTVGYRTVQVRRVYFERLG